MTSVIINPGSGPAPGAHLRDAWKNIRVFRRDLESPQTRILRDPSRDWDDCPGLYAFTLKLGRKVSFVHMPGLSLERVRYFNGANPWNFHRLYVDGNSWLWEFALKQVRDELGLPGART